jgi:universal stress protein E
MATWQRILVAIKQPGARRQVALARAAKLARATDATLHLFHDLSMPVALDAVVGTGDSIHAETRQQREAARARLERLAAPLRKCGLRVSTAAEWDYPAAEAIVREARSCAADLVVVARSGHHRLPALLGYTDWELLRSCPVPVLMVRTRARRGRECVVAAVDPQHAYAKPAALDGQILALAAAAGEALHGSVHAVHVLAPWLATSAGSASRGPASPGRAARSALRRECAAAGVATPRLHIMPGDPVEALPRTARRLHASVFVMGAMSRSGLRRLFVGNTAERVLDSLACDVLVVHPAGFDPRLPARRRGVYYLSTIPLT